MSIYYDLYENPDKEGTEEQKLLHARVVPSEHIQPKSLWSGYP